MWENPRSPMPLNPSHLKLKVDEQGALTPRKPAEWFVCFVPPIEPQWWHWMLRSRLKHCFAIRRDHCGNYIVFEPWWSRIFLACLSDRESQLFLTWASLGVTLKVREKIPGRSSQLRIWMSCAALLAHMLGRNYYVWTPQQLYNRLIKEPDVVVVDLP